MSPTVLKIIPTDPSFVPSITQQEYANDFLSKLFNKEQIEFTTTDYIEFIDQGENFDSVFCNLCENQIEMEDWQSLMDKAYESQFTNLVFITSCCNKTNSLNHLSYCSAAGFSKFAMKILDAQSEPTSGQIKNLGQIVGVDLRVVWAHY